MKIKSSSLFLGEGPFFTRAKATEELRKAVDEQGNVANANDAIMKGDRKIMPEILITGGNGSLVGLALTLMRFLSNKGTVEDKKGFCLFGLS